MADWDALARHVIDRRVERGHHSRESFAQASGISIRTLGDIETARRQSYAPETLVRLEKALEWPAGRVDEILDAQPRTVLLDLTREQFAGMDPVRSGVEFPSGLADIYHFMVDEYSAFDREEREQIERTINEFAKTLAMLARKKRAAGAVVVTHPDQDHANPLAVEVPEQHAAQRR